jgi:nitrogen fixation NifU-like protein
VAVGFSSVDDELFREIILDHYRNPRHKGGLDAADVTLEANNPLCGDEIQLSLRLREGAVEGIAFSGRGCSISQASASMMCDSVAGQPMEVASATVQRFRDMMLADGGVDELGDLEALQGVKRYPVRLKCALLPWNALLQGLADSRSGENRP